MVIYDQQKLGVQQQKKGTYSWYMILFWVVTDIV
jgi:hypothetical protein